MINFGIWNKKLYAGNNWQGSSSVDSEFEGYIWLVTDKLVISRAVEP